MPPRRRRAHGPLEDPLRGLTLRPHRAALAVGVAVTFAAATFAPAAAEARPFRSADLRRLVTIADPQISPDGRTAVALIGRVNAGRNLVDREIDAIDIASGERRVLTFERSGLAMSEWSPTGDRLAFIAARGSGDQAKAHVFVMPMNGGDARRVTDAPKGLSVSRLPVRASESRAAWLREESITYVGAVTTPVMLIADRGDARVANVSSYEFFHALRDLHKPVQFVVYPVDGHFPHDPARTADVYARWINYIGDHFEQ